MRPGRQDGGNSTRVNRDDAEVQNMAMFYIAVYFRFLCARLSSCGDNVRLVGPFSGRIDANSGLRGFQIRTKNAFFGVINIITKKSQDFGQPESSVSYGSYDSLKGRLSFGREFHSGVKLALSGSSLHAECRGGGAGLHNLFLRNRPERIWCR